VYTGAKEYVDCPDDFLNRELLSSYRIGLQVELQSRLLPKINIHFNVIFIQRNLI
jgi:hypothetical protein